MDIFLYADLALASLGVIVPMLILFIAVVIIVYVGHRRKQRMKVKKVIEELQIIHNTANNNGKVYTQARLISFFMEFHYTAPTSVC